MCHKAIPCFFIDFRRLLIETVKSLILAGSLNQPKTKCHSENGRSKYSLQNKELTHLLTTVVIISITTYKRTN